MNRNLIYIVTFGILLIIACGVLMSPVKAYPRVPQGGVVVLGSTYDISGVAAGYKDLAYIDQYTDTFAADNDSITYMIELPQQNELYYNYTINDDPFANRPGYWYRYNGGWDSHANNRAFYVVLTNQSFENQTANITVEQMYLPPVPPVVPERHVADYLLARGEPFNVTYNITKASIWIFGRVNGIYDRRVDVNGTAYFNETETQGLEPGTYTLVYYSPGIDRRFDLRVINNTQLKYFDSDEFEIKTIDITAYSPLVVLDRLRSIAGMNDDNFTEYKLEVQDPAIEITSVDTLLMYDYDNYNETGVFQVRGYTNLANNTNLSFVLDESKTPARMLGQSRMQNRWNTTVLAVENPGSMRYFDIGIPVNLAEIPIGEHNITAYGDLGARMDVTFWNYNLPEGQTRPNQTRHYIGGNEFVPTPTPEIVIQKEVVHEITTLVVNVPVTPSDDQVHAAQDKVTWEAISTIAGGAGVILVALGAGLYIIRLYYRRKEG